MRPFFVSFSHAMIRVRCDFVVFTVLGQMTRQFRCLSEKAAGGDDELSALPLPALSADLRTVHTTIVVSPRLVSHRDHREKPLIVAMAVKRQDS